MSKHHSSYNKIYIIFIWNTIDAVLKHKSFNIFQNDGLTLVLIGKKIEVIFASTEILYSDVRFISLTSKIGNNTAFIKIRITDFFVEMID